MAAEVQVIEDERIDPMVLIRDLIKDADGKPDPEALKTMFELQRQWVKDQAAQKYADALSAFHRDCPPIVKHKQADRYKYAPYEELMTVVGPFLNANKIVVTVTGPTRPDALDLTVHTRVGIHVESHQHVAPMPDLKVIAKDSKISEAQAYGNARSYAKRYAVTDALNLVVIGEDTDARLNPALCDVEQVRTINTLSEQCEAAGDPVVWEKLYAVYGIDPHEGLNAVTEKDAKKIISTLQLKLAQAKKGAK